MACRDSACTKPHRGDALVIKQNPGGAKAVADLHVVVLAAGKGTRMKSDVPKVLHRVSGQPLVEYVLRAANALNPASLTVIVGHKAESLRSQLTARRGVRLAVQEPQLGTAHAVMQAEPLLAGASGSMLVLSGDVPLLSTATLQALLRVHHSNRAAATVLTAVLERPYGYGRIVRSQGQVARIIEERDASPAERALREINAGVYVFDLEPLFPALRSIASQNAQGEYYLTDLVAIYRRRRLLVASETVADAAEIRGINSRTELAEVGALVRQKKNEELMAAGVTLVDPATTYVEPDVIVGADTVIHPNVYLEGRTTVGAACEIHAGVRVVNSTIGDRVTILNYSVITDSTVGAGVRLGPFAHLRPGSEVGEAAHIGNFVELKKTVLGAGSKASHLTYLGDATIGEGVNIGAGTITCNYDGVHKHQTVIEDGAFIGSDSQLVAPVRVGKGAYVAAGSSIVSDVPTGSLGIARGRQTNIEGWVARKKSARAAGADAAAEPGANPASRS
jgi:bifunctional UDP-N-acetylglucosamine pyrophosphorylase / glucosamine-1-phosphate N-acetyltransferase